MRFSFVTCTYNRAENLEKTLQSLVEQEYNSKDFQIIIINNNSTDSTSEICEFYINKYSTLNIEYYLEMSQGLSFALNRGIKEAKGEYIIYVDDDETIGNQHLLKLEKHLTVYPEIGIIATPVVPIYEVPQPRWMSPFTQRLIGGAFDAGSKVKKLSKTSYPGTGHTIIRRELYKMVGNYNTELGRKGTGLLGAEDKDMTYRLVSNNIDCYYLPDLPIYHHIPAYKLSNEFFSKLTLAIGKSEKIRTLSHSTSTYYKRLFKELVKWGIVAVLFFFYLFTLRPWKGAKLLEFRWNVTRGLLG